MVYKNSQFHLRWTLIFSEKEFFHSQINLHVSVNSLSWTEILFGKLFLCSFLLVYDFPNWFFREFYLSCYSIVHVFWKSINSFGPFSWLPYFPTKQLLNPLSLILSKIDTYNTRWRNMCVLNKKLSITGVKFSWILYKSFL